MIIPHRFISSQNNRTQQVIFSTDQRSLKAVHDVQTTCILFFVSWITIFHLSGHAGLSLENDHGLA